MHMSEMKHAAAEAACLMQALSHESRLMMLCMLVEGERSVGELAAITGLKQAAVSQHLAALREQGFVTSRREGRRRLYRHCDPNARAVVMRLYELYCPVPPTGPDQSDAAREAVE
mgnify:CR=1 FL=1